MALHVTHGQTFKFHSVTAQVFFDFTEFLLKYRTIVFIGIPLYFGNSSTMVKPLNGNEVYFIVPLVIPPM